MNGQWIVALNSGLAIVNIDPVDDHFEGVVSIISGNPKLPSIAATFATADKGNIFKFRTNSLQAIDPGTGDAVPWVSIKKKYRNKILPRHADVFGAWDDKRLIMNWTSSLGEKGAWELSKTNAERASDYNPLPINDWKQYKEYVAGLTGRRFIFRGQGNTKRLRTSFHRTGRADLRRFRYQDVDALIKHLSVRTRHVFNVLIPDEFGAFLNLVQHHGYPTPLLDWTYSPYVAAFFAYHRISNSEAVKAKPDEKVRIFIFDQKQWRTDFKQVQMLLAARPHLSILDFAAIENERLIPQQSVSTVTNLDDIENYIQLTEASARKQYLRVVDLPVRERTVIMDELSYMGISAGSLFPGLDGICAELKERLCP